MASGLRKLRVADGLDLALYLWQVERPRGVCLLVHGYAEHAGRYGAVAQTLTASGIEVWAMDLRGHGRSPGRRADVRRFHDYVSDVGYLREHVRAERPGLPTVLLGHSMGGVIGLRSALDRPDGIAGLVLSAPYLRPTTPPPGWLRGVVEGLAAALPLLPVQPFDARALSRDATAVAAYRRDPLTYTGWVKARMGLELIGAGPPSLARAGELSVPTLLMHGAADAIADPQASRDLAAAPPDGMVTLHVYPEAYHELFNDLDREAVLAELLGWIDGRLPAAGA